MLETKDYILLYMLYIVLSIIIMIVELYRIKKNKSLTLINFFMFFFLVIYCIVPMCCLKYISKGLELRHSDNIFSNEVYIEYIFVVISYIVVNLGYNLIPKVKENKKIEEKINVDSKYFYIASVIILLLGWMALLLFTKVYGSIFGIIKYASDIRNGIVVINNPYTFVYPICQFVLFASYMFLMILLNSKERKKIFVFNTFLLLLLSIFGSIVFFVADDGRMKMITYFLVMLFCIYHNRFKKIDVKNLLILIMTGLVILTFINKYDELSYYIKNGIYKNSNSNDSGIIATFVREYSYTYTNGLNIIKRKKSGEKYELRIKENIKAIVVSFLPKRIKKQLNVTDLGDYNTSFYTDTRGEIPTDLITASIYTWGYIGIIITPILMGIAIKLIDRVFLRYKELDGYYRILFYIFAWRETIKYVAYYDLSELIYNMSYIILTYCIVKFIQYTFKKKTCDEECKN